MITSEQKQALEEQVELHKKRLNAAGTELQKEGIQQLIDDLNKKLLEDVEDKGVAEHLQHIIDTQTAQLEKAKKNPSNIAAIVDKNGKTLKTKGDIDIEGLEKSIEDHQAQLEKLK